MLVYLLAIASGSGSLALFLTAFFLPEIHRKGDFIWSGIGLFYALVLWVMAAKVGGGLLLGETAGVAILVWAIAQVLQTRWKLVPIEQRSAPSVELVAKIEKLFSEESLQKIQAKVTELAGKVKLLEMGKTTPPSAPPATKVSPEASPAETLEFIPEATPEVTPEVTPETIVVSIEPIPENPVDQTPGVETKENPSSPAEPILPEPGAFKIPAPTSEPPPATQTPEE